MPHADAPSQPIDARAAARPAKADPSIDFDLLGIDPYSSNIDHVDVGIIAALAPAHPRAFWAIAKRRMFQTHACSGTYELARACAGDERLVRLGLATARAEESSRSYARGAMTVLFLGMALKLPGKGDAWRSALISENASFLAKLSADQTFDALGAAARAGHQAACEQLSLMMPDKRQGEEEAKKYRFGRCGFAHMDLSSIGARSAIAARLLAESDQAATGKSRASPAGHSAGDGKTPTNALFWIAARRNALAKSNPALAAAWGRVGAELIARGLEVEEDSASLGIAMGCAPMLEALVQSRPILGSPSFYCFHRTSALHEALSAIDEPLVAKVCSYDETGTDANRRIEVWQGGSTRPVDPIPAAAVALLAGRTPDPSWISIGANRSFKLPKSVIEAAKAGTLSGYDLEEGARGGRGQTHTIASLAAALGKGPAPAKPTAKPTPAARVDASLDEPASKARRGPR